ncbi:MAG: SAM-dependent methyltransferase [Proteobacteria bacterium]|nr:SAM-dependent methyltransferase [Pseudomonadota bacterium]
MIMLPGSEEYLMTFEEYMGMALYDEAFGYYSTGQVDFEKDFQTYAEEFAPLLADRFILAWQGMLATGEISADQRFYIYEFAAGNGKMAYIMMNYIRGKAILEPESDWAKFYKVLQYVIGEISPALAQQQKTLLRIYIQLGKLKVYETNAMTVNEQMPRGVGVVVSNELIDALPVHEIDLQYNSTTNAVTPSLSIVAPTLEKSILTDVLKTLCADKVEHGFIPKSTKDLCQQWGISTNATQELNSKNKFFIDKALMKILLSPTYRARFGSKIEMKKWVVPLTQLDNQLQQSLNEAINPELPLIRSNMLKEKKSSMLFYIPLGVQGYFENITRILERGYVFTLDYGQMAAEHVRALSRGESYLRTCSNQKLRESSLRIIGNNMYATSTDGGSPLARIGEKDITTDIDFSHLAEVGLKHGLTPTYYGTQDGIGGYFLQGLFILIQARGLSSDSEKVTTRNNFVLQDMDSSVPVLLNEMPAVREKLNEGRKYFENFNSAVQVGNQSPIKSTFTMLINWFKDNHYLTMNRAFFIRIEEELKNSLVHISGKSFFLDYIQNLLLGNNGQTYAEILMRFMNHHFQYSGARGMETVIAITDKALQPICSVLNDYIGRNCPDLLRKGINQKTMSSYNFMKLPDHIKAKTMLSVTLRVAEERLSEEERLLKKYQPPAETTLPTFEAALRRLTANGCEADVKFLIQSVSNIDAQDTNPESLKTALHWAVIKGYAGIAEFLMDMGARTDIPDARGKTAKEYADDSKVEGITTLFKSFNFA